MTRALAYAVCAIPSLIGVWFLADAAHSTSESGAASAVHLGLIAAAAYVEPLVALIVWRNGSHAASVVLWLLTAFAMVPNLSQTLDAFVNPRLGHQLEQIAEAGPRNVSHSNANRPVNVRRASEEQGPL